MIPSVIQPWGRAPTPLIPKSVIEKLGYLDAPKSLRKILGEHATLAELDGTLWNCIDSVSRKCLNEIVDILKPRFNSCINLRIYPEGKLPQSIAIGNLPFSPRTKNAVRSYPDKFSNPKLEFRDVLSVYSFGVRSAIDLACVIEFAIDNSEPVEINAQAILEPENEGLLEFSKIKSLFQTASAWALGELKLESLAGALPAPLPTWPPEVKKIWSELGNIGTRVLAGGMEKDYSVPDLVSQGLGGLDKRSLFIAIERIFVLESPATLQELGIKLNITRERVRQLEQKILYELDQFKSNKYLPIMRRAESLRDRLSSAVPANHSTIEDTLNWSVEDFDVGPDERQQAKSLLFWLAGPYQICDHWMLKDKDLPELTMSAFLKCRDQKGLIAQETATEILSGLGINKEHHQDWLEHLGKFLVVEEGLIYFQGSFENKAESLLRYYSRPMSVEEMLEFIESNSVRSFRQRLTDDPRFWRINIQNEFVLAGTEGYDEYTGITDEIIQELELCGGHASVKHLVEKLSHNYGVSELSVYAYLNAPIFSKDENGIIRVRDVESTVKISKDIAKTAACYLSDDGAWCWKIKIDEDLMRGSGRSIPNSFAQQLGCELGEKVEVLSEVGVIVLSWPLSSPFGASIGSLRNVLGKIEASLGDFLFIKATKPSVTFMCLNQAQVKIVNSRLVKLALLLGRTHCNTEDEAVRGIATALGVKQTTKEAKLLESRRILISRGEAELAELIQQPKLSVDEYIEDMSRLF